MNSPPCEAKFEVPLIAVLEELLKRNIGPEPAAQKRERWKDFLLLIRDLKSCHSSGSRNDAGGSRRHSTFAVSHALRCSHSSLTMDVPLEIARCCELPMAIPRKFRKSLPNSAVNTDKVYPSYTARHTPQGRMYVSVASHFYQLTSTTRQSPYYPSIAIGNSV